MPVVTTLPPTVNTYNTQLRAVLDQRFVTAPVEELTVSPNPGSAAQYVIEAVTAFEASVDSLEVRTTTLENTRAPSNAPTLTNPTTIGTLTANAATGTLGQYLTSGGSSGNTYWSTLVVPPTPSFNDVATVNNTTTRPITVSNTFAAGNTTITGTLSVGNTTISGTISSGNTTISGTLSSGNTTITGNTTLNGTLYASNHTRIGPYAGSTSTGNVTGLELINNGGTGESNVAAMSYHCSGYYGTHQHLRADGYFGIGGWSASAWRWYVNMATGDMTAAGSINSYSDPRLKKDITPIESALTKVLGWNGVKFRWIETSVVGKPGSYDYGVLSPDIKPVAPELVNESAWDSGEGDKYETVDYPKLVPFLIEAIKEQQKMIESLQQQVNELKTRGSV